VLVDDAEFDGDRMESEVLALLEAGRLEQMAAAAKSLGRPDAAAAVAALVSEAARA
jgi:UDP-N-acetylglucosamine:LPS N-acetylglucosamine transferase